jgi:serine/threonine protein phosphatase PrpC
MSERREFIPISDRHISPAVDTYQAIGERQEQQDRYLVANLRDGLLLMVADGHNGTQASSLLAENTTQIYSEERAAEIEQNPDWTRWGLPATKERLVIRRTIKRLIELTGDEDSGSTLTLAFLQLGFRIRDRSLRLRAHVGQMGDSFFAFSSRPGALAMTPIHSVKHNEKDAEAIRQRYKDESGEPCQKSSLYLYTGESGIGLAVTRALGDKAYTLIRAPEIKTFEADPDHALVMLASDGMLNSEEDMRDQVRSTVSLLREGMPLQELGENYRMQDNITMLAVRFPSEE